MGECGGPTRFSAVSNHGDDARYGTWFSMSHHSVQCEGMCLRCVGATFSPVATQEKQWSKNTFVDAKQLCCVAFQQENTKGLG